MRQKVKTTTKETVDVGEWGGGLYVGELGGGLYSGEEDIQS